MSSKAPPTPPPSFTGSDYSVSAPKQSKFKDSLVVSSEVRILQEDRIFQGNTKNPSSSVGARDSVRLKSAPSGSIAGANTPPPSVKTPHVGTTSENVASGDSNFELLDVDPNGKQNRVAGFLPSEAQTTAIGETLKKKIEALGDVNSTLRNQLIPVVNLGTLSGRENVLDKIQWFVADAGASCHKKYTEMLRSKESGNPTFHLRAMFEHQGSTFGVQIDAVGTPNKGGESLEKVDQKISITSLNNDSKSYKIPIRLNVDDGGTYINGISKFIDLAIDRDKKSVEVGKTSLEEFRSRGGSKLVSSINVSNANDKEPLRELMGKVMVVVKEVHACVGDNVTTESEIDAKIGEQSTSITMSKSKDNKNGGTKIHVDGNEFIWNEGGGFNPMWKAIEKKQ
ncbi:MAG: hypothetical protein LBB18_02495 [Puniceicoccales bacterium]|nr:hypothetical protein [Puniceicoccales bacterium]